MQGNFSFATRQAARIVGTTVEAIRTQYHRKGVWRGITPVVLPNGRFLWPRAQVLALAGKLQADRRTTIDLRATNPWIECRGLPPEDPGVCAMAIALNDPRDDTSRQVQEHLDDLYALRDWIGAQVARLHAARPRMSHEQWDDAMHLLGRSIGPAAACLPPEVSDLRRGAA